MKSLFVWSLNIVSGAISYLSITHLPFIASAAIEVIKTIALCEWMDHATKHKKQRHKHTTTTTFDNRLMIHTQYTVPNACIKHLIHISLIETTLDYTWTSLIFIIPRMFAFEVVFDFVHYFIHKACHDSVWLYQRVHKTHHTHVSMSKHGVLSTIQTMVMSPWEIVLVYGVPTAVAMIAVPMSAMEFCLQSSFLSYQEFGGHIGREMRPTSSFAQFIWLPRWLGIELYSEDHEMHHTHLNCNYGKRFSLADKMFGTFTKTPLILSDAPANEGPNPSQRLETDT